MSTTHENETAGQKRETRKSETAKGLRGKWERNASISLNPAPPIAIVPSFLWTVAPFCEHETRDLDVFFVRVAVAPGADVHVA